MSIYSLSATLRPLAIAACAGAMTLIATDAGKAQDDNNSSARDYERPPSQPNYETKSSASAEQQALRKAQQTSIKQAKALQDLTSQEKEVLNQPEVDRRVQQIGQSVESSRQHLASLEAQSPSDEKTRERFDEIREYQESASERQRSLMQQVAAPVLNQANAAKISSDAKDIEKAMKEAESAREKLPGATAAMDSSSRQAP
jgi:hypothetical protein